MANLTLIASLLGPGVTSRLTRNSSTIMETWIGCHSAGSSERSWQKFERLLLREREGVRPQNVKGQPVMQQQVIDH